MKITFTLFFLLLSTFLFSQNLQSFSFKFDAKDTCIELSHDKHSLSVYSSQEVTITLKRYSFTSQHLQGVDTLSIYEGFEISPEHINYICFSACDLDTVWIPITDDLGEPVFAMPDFVLADTFDLESQPYEVELTYFSHGGIYPNPTRNLRTVHLNMIRQGKQPVQWSEASTGRVLGSLEESEGKEGLVVVSYFEIVNGERVDKHARVVLLNK